VKAANLIIIFGQNLVTLKTVFSPITAMGQKKVSKLCALQQNNTSK